MSGATPVTPLDLLPPGETRNDDFYDNVTASTKLGYDVTDNFDLGFVGPLLLTAWARSPATPSIS